MLARGCEHDVLLVLRAGVPFRLRVQRGVASHNFIKRHPLGFDKNLSGETANDSDAIAVWSEELIPITLGGRHLVLLEISQ